MAEWYDDNEVEDAVETVEEEEGFEVDDGAAGVIGSYEDVETPAGIESAADLEETFDLDSAVAGAVETAFEEAYEFETPLDHAQSSLGAVPRGSHAQKAVPDTDVSAEVVLLMTSLGSVRRMYFASKRAQHLLNCKGVVYYVIDINRDVSDGADLIDRELYECWKEEGFLIKDPMSVNNGALIPQVLIDGVPVGDEMMLQDMEEDGDLDWVFARAACPACLNEKDPKDVTCPNCETSFRTLVPEEKVYQGQVQQLFKGMNYGAFGGGEVFEHPHFKTPFIRTEEGEECAAEMPVTYEDLFGEPPPPDEDV